MKTRWLLPLLAGFAMLAGAAAPAMAQAWPSRPLRLIVPFGAGSGTDIVARIVAQEVADIIGRPIVIENVGGAGGTIGVLRAARATPDGYTFIIGAVDTFAQSQFLFITPPANTVTEFDPVALAVEQPLVHIVRRDFPAQNLQEFAARARAARPGELSFGSAGVGAAPYLACAMLNSRIGVREPVHVPYRAAAPALQDMMMGRLDYYCPLAISAAGQIADGTLRALAVLTAERSPLFPDLPTAREQGIEVTDGYYWNGFFVPKGTPEAATAGLQAAIATALDRPSLQGRLRSAAATVVTPERRSRAYLEGFLASEIQKWSGIMREASVERQTQAQ
jgi:tripartite-type tricarboxylate transporter receptor subunit TctC